MSESKKKLIELIDMIPEIRKLFVTEYYSFVKPAGRPPIQTPLKRISKVPEYMKWKAEVEFELDLIPANSTIDEIKRLFRKIDNGWSEERDFDKLVVKLEILKKYIDLSVNKPMLPQSDICDEESLCGNIMKALVAVQKNPIYLGKKEDEINDGVRDILSMIYEVKDQTRQGESESGKSAGEIDFLICNQGMPVAIIEALKLSSLDKENLDKHINKSLEKYDPVGCPYAFILTYATGKEFESFWDKFFSYLCSYTFPYDIKETVKEVAPLYAESRHAKVLLNRNGMDINVHFYVIHIH